MQEAINNAQNQNDGKVVIPDDLTYLNGIILDNRLQLEIVNPNYKLQLGSQWDETEEVTAVKALWNRNTETGKYYR